MADIRSKNPADLVKYWVDVINEEHRKLAESLRNIAEASEALRRVTVDTQRLLTRD